MKRMMSIFSLMVTTLVLTAGARAAFEIPWSTIDGGGQRMTGGTFELSGTAGQCDAGAVMLGGTWRVSGGFWPGVAESGCACLADLDHDGKVNGGDIQRFVACMSGSGSDCGCADLNASGGVSPADLPSFVNALTSGTVCP